MEPKHNTSPADFERNREFEPSVETLSSPESLPNRIEIIGSQETKLDDSAIAAPLPIPVISAPTQDDSMAQPASNSASDATIPTVAGDEDLIEKEWVAKAKQVIAATKDDPYAREKEVTKLQIEYIRKRYGREIGKTDGE